MALSRYNPRFLRPFDDDWIVSDPFRDDFFNMSKNMMTGWNSASQISPLLAADLMETDTEFKVMADLPGVDPKDLELSLDNNTLVMKAERKHQQETKSDHYHSLERSYGSVQRRIRLPKNADLDHAETNFNNGVLTVTFPKLAEQTSRHRKLHIKHHDEQPSNTTITKG